MCTLNIVLLPELRGSPMKAEKTDRTGMSRAQQLWTECPYLLNDVHVDGPQNPKSSDTVATCVGNSCI